MKNLKITSLLLSLALVFGGCSSMNNKAKSGIIGGAGGAALGALIGHAAGNTAVGAVIGTAVGAGAGVLMLRFVIFFPFAICMLMCGLIQCNEGATILLSIDLCRGVGVTIDGCGGGKGEATIIYFHIAR